MPRNTLKSFPTAMIRSGLAHFHPASRSVAQPATDRGNGGTSVSPSDSLPTPDLKPVQPVAPVVPPPTLETEELVPVTGAA